MGGESSTVLRLRLMRRLAMSRTTSFFKLGSLKFRMFCVVESNVKMTRCKLQGGDGEVETGEQGEADLVTG